MPKHSKSLSSGVTTVNLYMDHEQHTRLTAIKSETGHTWNSLVELGADTAQKSLNRRKKR